MKHVSLYNATVDYYQSKISHAEAMLDMVLNESVVVGSHSNLLEEVTKWTEELSKAQGNLEALGSRYHEEEEESEETEDV